MRSNAWQDRKFNKLRGGKHRLEDSSKRTYGFWIAHIRKWRINGCPALDMTLDDITDIDVEDLQDDLV